MANSKWRRRPFDVTPEHLSGLDGFEALDRPTLASIARLMDGRAFAAGQEVVTHLDDDSRDVYYILSGTVRVTIHSPTGKELTYELLSSGKMFGELSAIDGEPRSASCVAETDVELAKIGSRQYLEAQRRVPDLAEASMRRLARLARHLGFKLYLAYCLKVGQRVAYEIYRLAEDAAAGANSVVIEPSPTDADIAGRAGTTREAVNREIAELSTQGLVHRQAGKLEVPDIAALLAIVKPYL